MPHTEQPVAPEKMKPRLHLDLEEIEGLGDVDISDRVVLEVKAKVMGINKRQDGDEEYTGVEFELTSVKLSDREVRKEPDETASA